MARGAGAYITGGGVRRALADAERELAEALRHIETLLSGDPDMPSFDADYEAAEAFLAALTQPPEESHG